MSLDRAARALRAFIPDPFVIALLLTLLALLLARLHGEAGLIELVEGWAGGARGFWSLLGFAMQMCLILVTGYAVAGARPVRRAIAVLARLPRNTAEAAALVSVCAMSMALLNWGLGLIGGALLAREVGIAMREQGRAVHYPLLGAAGYTGLCVWHGGLSGTSPLKVTQERDLVEVLGADLAAAVGTIPLHATVLSPRNLVVTGLLLVLIPLALALMAPRDPATFVPPPERAPEPPTPPRSPGVVGALESGPWVTVPIVILGGTWIALWAWRGGIAELNPDTMNFAFLMLGLALAGSPQRYMQLAEEAARACAGIIVQFPFYAGIMGIMVTGGLLGLVAGWLPAGSTTLSLATFLSGGAVNLFVPSGGGQWTIQGPVVMEAALQAGVDPGRVVLALAYGDQWTNLFQPFWALPLLGITGTRAGDILGYTALLGVVVGLVLALGIAVG